MSVEFEQTVTLEKARLDAAIGANNATFASTQEGRTKEFHHQLDEQAQAEKDRVELSEKVAAGYIANLDLKLEEATKLVEAVGLTGTASGYATYAKAATKSANRWSVAAVASFVLAIVVFVIFLIVD